MLVFVWNVFFCQSQKPAVKLERVSVKKNNYSDNINNSVNDKVYVTLLVCMYACVCVCWIILVSPGRRPDRKRPHARTRATFALVPLTSLSSITTTTTTNRCYLLLLLLYSRKLYKCYLLPRISPAFHFLVRSSTSHRNRKFQTLSLSRARFSRSLSFNNQLKPTNQPQPTTEDTLLL